MQGNNSGHASAADDAPLPVNPPEVVVGSSDLNWGSPRGSARQPSSTSLDDAMSEKYITNMANERVPPRRRLRSMMVPKKRLIETRRMKGKDVFSKVKKVVPALEWIPKYNIKKDLGSDLITGLTIAILVIPQGLSYGILAGLPAYYGLYASLVAPCIYALFGTSVQLAIGPFALISLLVVSTVQGVVDPEVVGEQVYIDAVMTTSMLVGIILVIFSILRLGVLVEFLAAPVMSGLTTAGALLIGISQLKHLFGLPVPSGSVIEQLSYIFNNGNDINWVSFGIGFGALILMILIDEANTRVKLLKRFKIPSALVAIVLSTLVVGLLNLSESDGVKVLGVVPSGLPFPRIPQAFDRIGDLMMPAFVIAIIGYALAMATSKTFAAQRGYEIVSNQELLALGLANLIGSIFLGYPSFGSLSRSAQANEMGARTPLHGVISAFIVMIVLLFFTGLLFHLPFSVLSAVILVALKSLFRKLKEPLRLWRINRPDALVWLITFFVTFFVELTWGLVAGVAVSTVILLQSVSRPSCTSLQRLPNFPWVYRTLARFPCAIPVPGVLILRFSAPLHFANRDFFQAWIRKSLIERQRADERKRVDMGVWDGSSSGEPLALNVVASVEGPIGDGNGTIDNRNGCIGEGGVGQSVSSFVAVRFIVLDVSSVTSVDSSALDILTRLNKELEAQNVQVIYCMCRGAFRDVLNKLQPPPPMFLSIDDGVVYAERQLMRLNNPSSAADDLSSSSEGSDEEEGRRGGARIDEEPEEEQGEERAVEHVGREHFADSDSVSATSVPPRLGSRGGTSNSLHMEMA